VANAMRKFLNNIDAVQSISLRTMLNFNRTYEQEMLYKIESPFADDIYSNDGRQVPPKSVEDSIQSFLSILDPTMRKQLEDDSEFRDARNRKPDDEAFVRSFQAKYGLNPRTGKAI
jgi:hypothetical protein